MKRIIYIKYKDMLKLPNIYECDAGFVVRMILDQTPFNNGAWVSQIVNQHFKMYETKFQKESFRCNKYGNKNS
jgi:hypothetical protein